MNKPGTTQLPTIATSQLTTIAGGVMAPIYRLPDPGCTPGIRRPPSYPPAPRPSTPPWAPYWPSRSGLQSPTPCHPGMPGIESGFPGQGQPTHHYYGV
jgi:hypothetical protein